MGNQHECFIFIYKKSIISIWSKEKLNHIDYDTLVTLNPRTTKINCADILSLEKKENKGKFYVSSSIEGDSEFYRKF